MDRARRKLIGGLTSAWLVPRWSWGLLAAVSVAPAGSLAQSTTRTQPKRVVILATGGAEPFDEFRKWFASEFAKHGFVDGSDIELTVLPADSTGQKLDEALHKAVALRADVILAHTNGFIAKRAFLPVTRDIPLVLWGLDGGGEESIEALHRRGENVTGALYSYLELVGMRFGLMKQLKPQARRCAIVIGKTPTDKLKDENDRHERPVLVAKARELGLDFIVLELPDDSPPAAVVSALKKERVDVAEVRCCGGRDLWVALAGSGILASSVGAGAVEEGALLGGWSVGGWQALVRLAAKVLHGTRAADIPVERSLKFGLAVNVGTARKLGITVPGSILLRADRVFE